MKPLYPLALVLGALTVTGCARSFKEYGKFA